MIYSDLRLALAELQAKEDAEEKARARGTPSKGAVKIKSIIKSVDSAGNKAAQKINKAVLIASEFPRCFCGRFVQNIPIVCAPCGHYRCFLCFLILNAERVDKCLIPKCTGTFTRDTIAYALYA